MGLTQVHTPILLLPALFFALSFFSHVLFNRQLELDENGDADAGVK